MGPEIAIQEVNFHVDGQEVYLGYIGHYIYDKSPAAGITKRFAYDNVPKVIGYGMVPLEGPRPSLHSAFKNLTERVVQMNQASGKKLLKVSVPTDAQNRYLDAASITRILHSLGVVGVPVVENQPI